MGLDMYFYARKEVYVSYLPGRDGEKDSAKYPVSLKKLEKYIERTNFKSITEETRYQIGYFRKFNALHGYIVKNYAEGVDECQPIYLQKENIEEMLNVCKAIQADHSAAAKLMPVTEGFFFGSTEYDKWYYEDVDDAVEFFELILETVNFEKYGIVYNASW